MEAMREAWTDERLDDLTHRVDVGFSETSQEFQALRQEMRSEFQAIRAEMQSEFAFVRSETRSEFQAVRSEAAAMHRTLLQVILGGFALMLVGFATTIATVLTQL